MKLDIRCQNAATTPVVALESTLIAHGLPVSPPRDVPFASHALIQRMQGDKKAERGRLTFVLTRALGDAFVARDVPASIVEAALAHALAA